VGRTFLSAPPSQTRQGMRYNLGRSPSPEGSRTTREINLATAISKVKHAREETEDGKSPSFIVAGRSYVHTIHPPDPEIHKLADPRRVQEEETL